MRKKLQSRKRLIDLLDGIFAFKIKTRDSKVRGRCPFHADVIFKPIECCFHFITRAKHCIRWDDRNAVGACNACNIKFEYETPFIDQVLIWYKETFGQGAWDQLVLDSHTIVKRSRTDLLELYEKIKADVDAGNFGMKEPEKVYGA